ncbi:MAG: DoxX family membrane protein [Terriglobales bacterium]
MESRLTPAWWALRIGLGATTIATGLDKFFNLLTNWSMYLSPLAERFLPVSADVFMRATGVVEVLVGLAILTRFTRYGAYVASIWLLCIAANLLSTGNFYDLALRDLNLAIAAFALARLAESRAVRRSTAAEPMAALTNF